MSGPGARRQAAETAGVSWQGDGTPFVPPEISAAGWLRVLGRGALILSMLAVCFPLLLALRPVEALAFGQSRPVTPYLTQVVCILTCRVIGLKRRVRGAPMRGQGAYVANHASWLDIFVLNAAKRLYFVAKSEVRGWAGIGWLARGTGTLFVVRARGEAARQQAQFRARLDAGHRLLFFPEATSSDGLRVLPFKSTPFAAFFEPGLRQQVQVQPVSLRYTAPPGRDARFYGWWGDMGFAESLCWVLAEPRQGAVEVIYHPPLAVAQFEDRKALARAAEEAVRAGFSESRQERL